MNTIKNATETLIALNRPTEAAAVEQLNIIPPLKPYFKIPLVALCALALLIRSASAQSWQTVDDYQYVAGAGNYGLTVAPSGVIFASGFGNDATGLPHGLVLASADDGNSWSTPIDDFLVPDSATQDSGIVADSAGNLYVSGYYYFDTGNFHQFVRRSADGGVTWATVDDYAQSPAAYPLAAGISADSSGNVFVAEYLFTSAWNWFVRKGAGGTNFTTVDSFQGSGYAQANAVYAHPTAGVFAVGTANVPVKNGTTRVWLVRRSIDGGATWATVDSFQSSGAYTASASGVGADAHGNIYVVGQSGVMTKTRSGTTTTWHWIVRKSSNGGASWSTIDDYTGGQAEAFAADSNGNLFVAGSTGSGWTVRESVGGTGSWTTVDTLANATPLAVTADRLGHVFVGGETGNDWIVRRH